MEILETLKDTEVKEEKESEKQIVIEELEQDLAEKESNKKEEKSNLEKTVEIESNVESEENEDEE